MLIRVHIDKPPVASYRTGHKPLALVYSLALHVGVIALLFLPMSLGSESNSPYHSVVVQLEKDHKLIYYDFRKELPEVSASNPTGQLTTPSPDAPKSKQTIVAQPKENPGKQLVYVPEPRVKLQTELTAPNLIAIETPVQVPLPDRPQPKPFQAPEAPKTTPSPVTPLPNAPALAANTNVKDPAISALLNKPSGPIKPFTAPVASLLTPAAPAALPNAPSVSAAGSDSSSITSLLNKPAGPPLKKFNAPAAAPAQNGATPAPLPSAPAIADGGGEKNSAVSALLNKPNGPVRQFTPPTQSSGGGTAPAPAALPAAPAVGGSSGDQSSAVAALLNKPGGPPPKPFTAPTAGKGASNGSGSVPSALPAPPSVAAGGQPASATMAILGLNPANVPQIPRPEGSRAARIEAGTPIPGATRAELGGGNSSISVPDISIQGTAPSSPATATRFPLDRALAPPTGLAHPQAPKVLATTPHMSTPQWPNSRRLPAAVEHHFQNRVVYISLIPTEQSGDDWILWYADTAVSPPDPNLVVHPPTLMKAGALPPFAAHNDQGTGSIRLTGVIGKDGHFVALSDLAGAPADKELTEALQGWQFGPARRNGVVFDADTVIEIPVVFGKLSLR